MDSSTRRQIDKATQQILKEAGIQGPPVNVETILDHLRLHRDFYDLADPGLLRRFWHKVKVRGHELSRVIRKIKLAAVWLPDEKRILVDAALPSPKQEWASFHDSVHRILDWHREFFLGDTAQTLDPEFQEMLEAEANYGASALMFCGPLFTGEALQTAREWSSIEALQRRYRKSTLTTLRRYVEHGHDHPMFLLVSTPCWKEKPEDQPELWRHFVGSPPFNEQFSRVTPESVLNEVDLHAVKRRGGPVADFTLCLMDDNGFAHEFRAETFFNSHYLLTFATLLRPVLDGQIIVPSAAVPSWL